MTPGQDSGVSDPKKTNAGTASKCNLFTDVSSFLTTKLKSLETELLEHGELHDRSCLEWDELQSAAGELRAAALEMQLALNAFQENHKLQTSS